MAKYLRNKKTGEVVEVLNTEFDQVLVKTDDGRSFWTPADRWEPVEEGEPEPEHSGSSAGDELREQLPPATIHCPSCAYDLRPLLRPLIREILIETEAEILDRIEAGVRKAEEPESTTMPEDDRPRDSQGHPLT